MSDDNDKAYTLRPDAVYSKSSPDCAQIAFENSTVTFSGLAVVRALDIIVPILQTPQSMRSLLADSTIAAVVDAEIVKIVAELLQNSMCIYESEDVVGVKRGSRRFLSSIGLNPSIVTKAVKFQPLVICPSDNLQLLLDSFEKNELRVEAVATGDKDSVSEITSAALTATRSIGSKLIFCWGYPYRSALPREINAMAVAEGVEVLFGHCESLIGRVGPWVVPGNNSCIECLVRRFISNGGRNEIMADEGYRRSTEECVPPQPILHPAFEQSVISSYVLEATRIMWRLQPTTLGSLWEHNLYSPKTTKRVVLRVPRCPVCGCGQPTKLPWDSKYPELSAFDAIDTAPFRRDRVKDET